MITYPRSPTRHLDATEYADGLRGTIKGLAAFGLTRAELHELWLTTPGGIFASRVHHPLADPEYATQDGPFVRDVLAGPSRGSDERMPGLQAWLFGDQVDAYTDAPPDQASDRERDGWYGPATDRRLRVWMKALGLADDDRTQPWHEREGHDLAEFFVWDGVRHESDGIKVLHSLTYADDQKGLHKWGNRKATIAAFWHWTAGWTARGGFKVLRSRNLPTTFLYDVPSKTDGTCAVYQCFDPAKYRGTHGGSGPNRRSKVSGDLVTPAMPKYRDKLERMTGHRPPLIRGARNGGESWVIGYYLGQIEALLTITTLCARLGGFAPRIATGHRPDHPSFFPTQLCYPKGAIADGKNGQWGNVLTHLEASRRGAAGPNGWGGPASKWDCAGLWTVIAVACRRRPELLLRAPWVRENLDLDSPWWDTLEDGITGGRYAWDYPELGLTR